MNTINFFYEEIEFRIEDETKIKNWIDSIINSYNNKTVELNYIFCNDEYLHKINVEYLNHDTYTDIITFDNSEEENEIEGDLFISIERIKENAILLNTDTNHELHRVMIHGVLHLIGYGDKSEDDKKIMRKKEDEAIASLS